MQDIRTNIDDWIAAALAGDLSPEEQTAFDRHLQENGESRALFEETKAMSTAIEETLQTDRPGPGFEARMISGFREKAAKPRVPLTSRIARWIRMPAFYIPATAVVLVGMVIIGERVTNEHFGNVVVTGGVAGGELKKEALRRNGVLDDADETTVVPIPAGSVISNGVVAETTQAAPVPATALAPASRVFGAPPVDKAVVQDGQTAADALKDMEVTQRAVQGSSTITAGGAYRSSPLGFNQPANISQVRSGYDEAKNKHMQLSAQNSAAISMISDDGKVAAAPQIAGSAIPDARKLIRNATVDLEVKSYDEAVDAITAMVRGSGGYVDTTNSARLPNGKVSGTVVVKIPPGALDNWLLQLRSLGDLKNQSISTDDVTNQYFDIDARLRNAQKMEGRLLDLLNTMTGRVSELLQVERELGRVRENIEQMQGQLKLYDSLVQYATITVSLREKDLNEPAAYLLRESAALVLVSPGVEKAYTTAKQEAEAAHAQIVQSQLTQQDAGNVSAVLSLLIDPDRADALIDQIRALGRVQNFNKHEERIARDGSGDSSTAREERDKVALDITIMPAEEQPAQFTDVAVQSSSVEQQAARIKQDASGFELKGSTFERTGDGSEAASMVFRLPLEKYPAFLARIQDLDEVKGLTVRRQDQNGGSAANAVAEVSLRIYSQPAIVADDNGLFATLRRTLAEAFGGVMWSVRMIGVAVAFLVPWALALAALVWVVRLILCRKSGKRQRP